MSANPGPNQLQTSAIGLTSGPVPNEGRTALRELRTTAAEEAQLQSGNLARYLLFGRVFNVRDYGAGQTADDTDAIQAAVTRAEAVAGVVLIPFGSFTIAAGRKVRITAPILVSIQGAIGTAGFEYEDDPSSIFVVESDDVQIVGTGTLHGPGSTSQDTVADIADIPSLIRVTNADRVIIRGLEFDVPPMAGVIATGSDYLAVDECTFIGGVPVADAGALLNYYGIFAFQSDFGRITKCRFLDAPNGNTFAEGGFLYFCDGWEMSGNFGRNVADHDFYLFHSIADVVGVNNHNVITDNLSLSTLPNGPGGKVGSSYKVHGEYNRVTGNSIINSNSGVLLEGGAYSTISDNTIVGFEEFGIIVSDLVAPYTGGLSYITIEGNTLRAGNGATAYGIYFRGDPVFSIASGIGSRIAGNTIVQAGRNDGSIVSPIAVFHSLAPFSFEGFTIADNTIIGQRSIFGVYCDRVNKSKFARNTIKDGTLTGWRGIRFQSECRFNTLEDNVVRDDQAVPLLAIGFNPGGVTVTDTALVGNRFSSRYALRSTNPWSLDPAFRIVGDRNTHGDDLGYHLALSTTEAFVDIPAAPSVLLPIIVPAGARIVGAQLRVDAALAGGDLWDAVFSGGAATVIATAQAVAQNTKVSGLFADVTTASTNITISKSGGGNFTAQGRIRALVYFEQLTTLGDV